MGHRNGRWSSQKGSIWGRLDLFLSSKPMFLLEFSLFKSISFIDSIFLESLLQPLQKMLEMEFPNRSTMRSSQVLILCLPCGRMRAAIYKLPQMNVLEVMVTIPITASLASLKAWLRITHGNSLLLKT